MSGEFLISKNDHNDHEENNKVPKFTSTQTSFYNLLHIKDGYGDNQVIYLSDSELEKRFVKCDPYIYSKYPIRVKIIEGVNFWDFWNFIYNSSVMQFRDKTVHINNTYICITENNS